MKKIIILLLLTILPMIAIAPVYTVDEKALYQQWQDRKFIENIKNTDFSSDNLKRLIDILCKHPEIVYAQARLETGEFKSKLAVEHNNLFGMKVPKKRYTVALGDTLGHARYAHWSESVYDYMYYQQYYESLIGIDLNYVDYLYFLKMYGYAKDKAYINKLKNLI